MWASGADGALIEAGYETDCLPLKKTYPSPNAVTQENFKDHLADHKYVNDQPSPRLMVLNITWHAKVLERLFGVLLAGSAGSRFTRCSGKVHFFPRVQL